ncbi:hypothetical protein [Thermoplasma volcanium GSS1]|uniref:Uncharacterized protein n=1 Tax=Thermoplasma volcanium (strain ATCC 51530 / DSM 4299 / JCM 9571 / NBRC 15438 / GSS1) TaxID=273116 RepID=Q97B78_THEVO|nr:DsrE family protein [Thermoplasma volcanium]BAB59721.1 hypothetical protein [Thermoplasma volcanium GSS1]
MKVITNVTDPSKVGQVVRNLMNLLREDPSIEVEVVFHVDAITVLSAESENKDVYALLKNGINVVACRNSMIAKGMDSDSLILGVTVVNAGIYELVKKISEGWIYIRL